jgi:hypothetical protein
MKLRIKGDSVRFRVAPSEVDLLLREGTLESRVHFSLSPEQSLHYALVLDGSLEEPRVSFRDSKIIARLPKGEATRWASTEAVSLLANVILDGSASLTLLVEKDFACLDLNDEENKDTFPNPNASQLC